jgi:hypothetical protein
MCRGTSNFVGYIVFDKNLPTKYDFFYRVPGTILRHLIPLSLVIITNFVIQYFRMRLLKTRSQWVFYERLSENEIFYFNPNPDPYETNTGRDPKHLRVTIGGPMS